MVIRALSILTSSRSGRDIKDLANQTMPDAELICEAKQRLLAAVVLPDDREFNVIISEMRQAGVSVNDIQYIFVPAIARRLGEAWKSDTASFTAVTIGCARLQSLARQLGLVAPPVDISQTGTLPDCLVLVPQGAQHTLGAIVLTSQLRQAGAQVKLELDASAETVCNLVSCRNFDAVMISASMSEDIEGLCSLVKSARCKGRDTSVFIGGSILDQYTDLVARTETDYATNDWQGALDLCNTRSPPD